MHKWKTNFSLSLFYITRKECSLDVEIAASGYTKEMQEDDELLYPAGLDAGHKAEFSPPEQDAEGKRRLCSATDQETEKDFTDEGEDASEELEQTSEEDSADEIEQSLGLKELCSALQPVEGQIIAARDGAKAASSVIDFSEDKKKIEKSTKIEDQTGQGEDPADKENEDECPDLVDLSTLNREFRPFRYRSVLIVEELFMCVFFIFPFKEISLFQVLGIFLFRCPDLN